MERRGGCCIARYAGGGGSYNENKMMERAMLKFRPIAPKPANGAGSAFGSSSSDNKTSSRETTYVKATGRGKRKYNIANNNNRKRRCNAGVKSKRVTAVAQDATSKSGESTGVVVTLPLLPESPTYQNNKTPTSPPTPVSWLSFNNSQQIKKVVESVVTVECVTKDIWVNGDGEGLGRTDEERLRNLEWDTCPGFITDDQMKVKWINTAYKKTLVNVDNHNDQVVVWVEMKNDIRVHEAWGSNYPVAFTCRVRVQQKGTKDIKILPCDVWRMDCGGFAWRLDVKAALSLGC